MTTRLRSALFSSLLVGLSACAFLAPRPASDLFILRADVHASGRFIPLNVVVASPVLAPGLDTSRIAVLKASNNINYYNGVAWAQPLGEVLQTFLVDALTQSRLFKSVSSDKEGVYADMFVNVDVGDFEVDDSVSPARIRIRLLVKLVGATSHAVLAAFSVEKTVPVNAVGMESLIVAFNHGMNAVASQIVQDVDTFCSTQHGKGKTPPCLQ
jgi:ABC-type uncharacterized transport system auxiliary subunit